MAVFSGHDHKLDWYVSRISIYHHLETKTDILIYPGARNGPTISAYPIRNLLPATDSTFALVGVPAMEATANTFEKVLVKFASMKTSSINESSIPGYVWKMDIFLGPLHSTLPMVSTGIRLPQIKTRRVWVNFWISIRVRANPIFRFNPRKRSR